MKSLAKNANVRVYGCPQHRSIAIGQLKRQGYTNFIPFVRDGVAGYGLTYSKSRVKSKV